MRLCRLILGIEHALAKSVGTQFEIDITKPVDEDNINRAIEAICSSEGDALLNFPGLLAYILKLRRIVKWLPGPEAAATEMMFQIWDEAIAVYNEKTPAGNNTYDDDDYTVNATQVKVSDQTG